MKNAPSYLPGDIQTSIFLIGTFLVSSKKITTPVIIFIMGVFLFRDIAIKEKLGKV